MKFFNCFFLLIAMSMSAWALPNEQAYQKAKEIQKDQIKLRKCELNNEEAIEAAKFDLLQQDISAKSFSDMANKTRILIKALRKVLAQGGREDIIFTEMELEKHGITRENWNYYTKNYKTEEQIDKLEEMIPDNDDKIVEQCAKQLKPILEKWLLEMKIIMGFDNKNPLKQALPYSEKFSQGWEDILKGYDIKPKDREIIMQILSLESPFSPPEQKYWRSFFKHKLEK